MLVLILFFFASPPGRRALVNRTIGPLLTIWWETSVFHDSFPLPIAASSLCPLRHQVRCCSHPDALMNTGDNRIICCNQARLSVCTWTTFRSLPVSAERCSQGSTPNLADTADHLDCKLLFLLPLWGIPPPIVQVIRELIFQETGERTGKKLCKQQFHRPWTFKKGPHCLLHHPLSWSSPS